MKAWTTSGPPSLRFSPSRTGPTPPAPFSAEWDRTDSTPTGAGCAEHPPQSAERSRPLGPERVRPGFSLNAARSDPHTERIVYCAGGEQAANPLQPTSSIRHTTTPDLKVRITIAASRLVMARPYLFSHGRSHRFDPCHAHQHKQPPSPSA